MAPRGRRSAQEGDAIASRVTTYFELVGEPEDLAQAVDVDALLHRVLAALGVTADDLHAVEVAYLTRPCRIEVRPGGEITDLLTRVRGCACGDGVRGLCLTERLVWVLRLDWPGLLAHELVHVVQLLTHRPVSETEAARIADQVA